MMQAYRGALPKEAERGHEHGIQSASSLLRTTSRDSREGRQSRWVGEECPISLPRCGETETPRPGAVPRVNLYQDAAIGALSAKQPS